MPLRVPRNVWVLSLTSLLRDVASEMLVHLLPLFLANVLGVRLAVIGLIEGIAETTASLVKILSGWLSDRLGRRKGAHGGRIWVGGAGHPSSSAGADLAAGIALPIPPTGSGRGFGLLPEMRLSRTRLSPTSVGLVSACTGELTAQVRSLACCWQLYS